MPLGPGRRGVGVIGAPVAKAAVVGAAISPGPSPVAPRLPVRSTTFVSFPACSSRSSRRPAGANPLRSKARADGSLPTSTSALTRVTPG